MFWQRFYSLCVEKGIKPNSIREELGISSTSTITKWKNGATPEGKVLGRIAAYFGVTVPYLLGYTDDPTPPGMGKAPAEAGVEGLTPQQLLVRDIMRQLPPEDQEEIARFAEFRAARAMEKAGKTEKEG